MPDKKNSQNVPLKKVEKFYVSPSEPDQQVSNEEKEFLHLENLQNAKLGRIGKILGGGIEKSGNVSALIAFIVVIYLGILIFDQPANTNFDDIFTGLTSILTLILGYLFGSNVSK